MKKYLLLLIVGIVSCFSASALDDWKLYATIDSNVINVIDTPDRVYVLSYAQPYSATSTGYGTKNMFISYYDKNAEEYITMTNRDGLSENVVQDASYNADKKYLLVVYSNYNIDLIYDNGKIVNIPGYMMASVAGNKAVNDITFDSAHNRAYLATQFGYLEINDAKGEISTSRTYYEPVTSVARLGDDILILKNEGVYKGKYANPNFNITDFEEVMTLPGALRFLPLTENLVALQYKTDNGVYAIKLLQAGEEGLEISDAENSSNSSEISATKNGYLLGHKGAIVNLRKDGTFRVKSRAVEDRYICAGSWDMDVVWYMQPRVGLYARRYSSSTGKTETIHEPMLPNAPLPYYCRDMVYHPRHGMLAVNHGFCYNFAFSDVSVPILLSGVKNGMWTRYAPVYTNTDQRNVFYDPLGMSIDPDNDKYVYFGSMFYGLLRLNLDDPTDILHLSHTSDKAASNPGFVKIVDDLESYKSLCKFSAPKFDRQGNMWSAYNNSDNKGTVELWYWTAANRKATTNASNYRPLGKIVINGQTANNFEQLYPLSTATNQNILIYTSDSYSAPLILVDHKGTLDNTSDDEIAVMSSIYDQDGSVVDKHHIKDIYEDPATGLVWVCTMNGVFYFEPRQAFKNPALVTRPKVSRNDGSGFADYLLNGVDVMKMTVDGNGRKWFATNGAGIVCTSADGRTIVQEYTHDNSWLPSDNVYTIGYNAGNRSIMVSTEQGLAELFYSGGSSSDNGETVRAYPNPVRPDYYGYVTIDGLEDNALVKIVDASGNLVKEIGMAENGVVQWDATNTNHKRVSTGVYYVLASSGPGDGSFAKVTKILVMN